jgi:hypothetical protein
MAVAEIEVPLAPRELVSGREVVASQAYVPHSVDIAGMARLKA